MTLYGRVHEDSVNALITQWRAVKAIVASGVGGQAPATFGSGSARASDGHHGSGRAAGIPSGSSRSAAPSGAPSALRRDSAASAPAPAPGPTVPGQAVSAVGQLSAALRRLRDRADEHGLDWDLHFTPADLERMASIPGEGAARLSEIQNDLRAQLRAKKASGRSSNGSGSER